MSKSMARVIRALEAAGLRADIHALGEARTAAQAAAVAGCHIDQIAKSIIFAGADSGQAVLFLTAGGNQVDAGRASALAGEDLGRRGHAASHLSHCPRRSAPPDGGATGGFHAVIPIM